MFEHQHVEAFGRGIDRGRETRRSGANDDDVSRCRRVELTVQTQSRGEGFDGGIPQHHAGSANHYRHVLDSDLEPIQERLHVGLALHLLVREGLSVSTQELSDTQGVRRVSRADEDQAAAPVGDERHSPQNERAHQDLAQLEVPLHERTQMLAIHDDDRPVADGARANQIAACRQHVDLARELARTVHGHPFFTAVERAHDLDGALDDHEEAGVLLAELEEHLARANAASRSDAGDPADLSGRQLGEHLIAALDVHLCHVVSSLLGGEACPPRYT